MVEPRLDHLVEQAREGDEEALEAAINQQQGTSNRFIVQEFLRIPLLTDLPVPF